MSGQESARRAFPTRRPRGHCALGPQQGHVQGPTPPLHVASGRVVSVVTWQLGAPRPGPGTAFCPCESASEPAAASAPLPRTVLWCIRHSPLPVLSGVLGTSLAGFQVGSCVCLLNITYVTRNIFFKNRLELCHGPHLRKPWSRSLALIDTPFL